MLGTLRLLLPILLPSWRFFAGVGPSPRVQGLLSTGDRSAPDWRDFGQPPENLSAFTMLCRLFFSPGRNEDLFLVSLSERMITDPTDHTLREIWTRIDQAVPPGQICLRFRLCFVSRENEDLVSDTLYQSDPRPPNLG